MIRKPIARLTIAAALGATVLTGLPTLALADTSDELQAQLDQANAHLNDLYAQASEVSEQVNQTQADLDQTNSDIEQKKAELSQAQDTLASRVNSDYKTGGVSLATIIFDSSSFEELVSRVFYASKASQSDAEVIGQVKSIESELAAKQAQQQQLLADQQSQQEELNSKVDETQSYVSSLDQQVQDKIAEEQAAYQAEQARLQAEAQAQAQAAGGYVTTADVNGATEQVADAVVTGGTAEQAQADVQQEQQAAQSQPAQSQDEEQAPAQTSKPSSGGTSGSSSSSGLTAAQRSAIVAAAWSKVGSSYVYGATGPNSFDCSGFTRYCYAAAGISLERTSEAQGGQGHATSNPQAGDLVCWGGHVGIYLGDGMMIDAGTPSTGVSYRAVYGSPWYRSF